jgi:hypothetical protein
MSAIFRLSLLAAAGMCLSQPAAAEIIVGAGPGAGPHVKRHEQPTQPANASFMAFDASFQGGVRVASGDVNGDGFSDIIVGAGPGAPGGHVKVFDGATLAQLDSFIAFGATTSGGVYVAAGDIDGDGRDDIIVGAAANGHVKVFSGADGSLLRSFLAFGAFSGGVSVAAGDINGDGRDDIVVGADEQAPGGHVKVFDGNSGAQLQSFFAFPGYTGGVSVAVQRSGGAGDDLLIGGTTSYSGHVKVFNGMTGEVVRSFFAFTPSFAGGVNVASGDVNGDGTGDYIAGMADQGSMVAYFDGKTGAPLGTSSPFGTFTGGIFVGGSTGPRRCSPDFDGDGDAGTDADIEAFFACLGGDCCATCGSADFDGDGDAGTDADIEAFFRVIGGGRC